VIRAKRSFSQKKASIPRQRAVRHAPAWPWRLGSVLMVVLLATVLAPKSEAAVASRKIPVKPKLNVVVIGDFYSYGYATSSQAMLRKSVPPTLQALNQVQSANSGVQVNVLFIPVTAATNSSLFAPASQGELPALIGAVTHASVVIVGIGGGNAALAGPMRNVLFDSKASAKVFPQLMTSFYDGYYLYAQTALLDAIATHTAPGTSIVTLGYPAIPGQQQSSGFKWWSPFTWHTVNQQQANMSDQLVSAVNTANKQATSIVAAAHSGQHFLYADLSGAMQGQTAPTQTAIGNDLLPYVGQAVSNELVATHIRGAQDTLPATSTPQWKLNVVLPVATHTTTRRHANPKYTPPPQNNQDNPQRPVYQQPPAWDGWPSPTASPTAPAAQAPQPAQSRPPVTTGGSKASTPPVAPSRDATPTAQSTGNGHGHQGGHGEQSSQPADGSQPKGSTQPTSTSQPKTSSQPAPEPKAQPQPVAEPQPASSPSASSSSSAAESPSAASSPSAGGMSAGPNTATGAPAGCQSDPALGSLTCFDGQTTTAAPGQVNSLQATAPASASPTSTAGANGGNNSSSSPAAPNTTSSPGTPSPGQPAALPMIPAPPTPLPEPITMGPAPDVNGPGTDPSQTGVVGTTPVSAATPPTTTTAATPPTTPAATTPAATTPASAATPPTTATAATPASSAANPATAATPPTTPAATTPASAATPPTTATQPTTPTAATPASAAAQPSTPTAATPAPAAGSASIFGATVQPPADGTTPPAGASS